MNLIVLAGYGLNCEEETVLAFMEAGKYLNMKVTGRIVHINALMADPNMLREYDVMVVPGGFSYGDDTGAGNAFALRMATLKSAIQEFLERDTLLLGICNGCQILLRIFFPNVALVSNDIGRYQCRWVRLKSCNDSVWLKGIDELYIPVAHGEGKFYATEDAFQTLKEDIALRYIGEDGQYAQGRFPDNPNGSVWDIAALSANGGRTLLMMPHPERAVYFTQRYDWTDIMYERKEKGNAIDTYADGFKIFTNAVMHFA